MTVLCSDKTGTLTKNELTVKEVYVMPSKGAGEEGQSAASVLHYAVLASKPSNQDPVRSDVLRASIKLA